jgi:hypothetical protein
VRPAPGGFARSIDDLKDMVDDDAIVETQLPIWGDVIERFGFRSGECLGITCSLAFQSRAASC